MNDKTPIFIIVEGATKTGKTSVIDRTCRALAARDVRVLHHVWETPKPKMHGVQAAEFMINQAYAFDAALENLAKDYDVVICEKHPLICGGIFYRSIWKENYCFGSVLYSPHLVFMLHADERALCKRLDLKLKGNDYKNQLARLARLNKSYLELPKKIAGTAPIYYRDTSEPNAILYASGWLRDWIMTALQK